MMRAFVFLFLYFFSVTAFRPTRQPARFSTELFEDFNLKKTVIVSDAKIFSEKQLREYTATYSTDERWNPFEALTGLLNKKDSGSSAPSIAPTSVESSLKSTISLAVLEEKTAAYVAGKINAGAYKKVLEVAFGDKLAKVLPQIKANLPPGKAKGL
jgi:hypothetical protein